MSVTSGFFNSLNHDRKYDATQMSSLFDGIINDGVFMSIGTHLNVTPAGGLVINVGVGKAWFNHTWTLNDAELPLSLDAAELVLDRIDAVVLEVNASESVRDNSIKIVKGEPSSEPARPIMEESETVHQYALAYIYVKANATTITESEITNMIGTGDTPFITGILETINIDSLIAQWKSQWNDQISKNQKEYDAWLLAQQTSFLTWRDGETDAFSRWKTTEQAEFEEWFANLQNQLDENQATNLQNQIDKIRDELEVTGGSRVIVTIDDKKGTVNVTGLTATLRIGGSEYTATVGDDNKAMFTGVLEIGVAEIECNDSTQGLNTECTLEIPYYGSYEATTVKIDMYEQWLATVGYTLDDYPEVSNILSDEEAMFRMMNLHASVDYWVRWYNADNTILPKFTASSVAMKAIGDNDYAADTLMDIPEVKEALLASEYWEYILNAKVPTMTSNTAPEGEVSAYMLSTTPGTNYYVLFSGDPSTAALDQAYGDNGVITNMWVQYKFVNPTNVRRVAIAETDMGYKIYTASVQYSNDGSTWYDAGVIDATDNPNDRSFYYYDVPNDNYALYWRIKGITSKNDIKWSLAGLQFYGRQLNALVPTMISNTEPSGEAISSNDRTDFPAYGAFDGVEVTTGWNEGHQWSCSVVGDYVGYKFDTEVSVKYAMIKPVYRDGLRLKNYTIKASNDENTWDTIHNGTIPSATSSVKNYVSFDNDKLYKCWIVECVDSYASNNFGSMDELQFYGPNYEEIVKPVVGGKFDYAAWCEAAGMNPGNYASLDDLLDNEKGVRTLMTKTASVDYLVQALSGDSASANTILNDIYVAKWVNYREYAYSSLSAVPSLKTIMDETGKYGMYITAIKSDAKPVDEEVDKALIPTLTSNTGSNKGLIPVMTSNTCEVGEAFVSDYETGLEAYKAFDSNSTTLWRSKSLGGHIGYKFTKPTCIKQLYLQDRIGYASECQTNMVLQGSNDGSTWGDIQTLTHPTPSTVGVNFEITNDTYYLYYRILGKDSAKYMSATELQFYGYQLIPMVPTLTSNTGSDGGEVLSSGENSNYPTWKAYDNIYDAYSGAIPLINNNYYIIGYKFPRPIVVKSFSWTGLNYNYLGFSANAILEASNNGSDWTALASGFSEGSTYDVLEYATVNTTEEYQYYRIKDTAILGIQNLQFYGVKKWQPKGLVPVMTSNTAPYGEASASSTLTYNGVTAYAFHVFDGNDTSTEWSSTSTSGSDWVQYKFNNPTVVTAFSYVTAFDNYDMEDCIIQASNDGSTWVDLLEFTNTITESSIASGIIKVNNTSAYCYYRLSVVTANATYTALNSLQFYGRQLEALVPPMTSNTAPVGEASASNEMGKYPIWYAFNGTTTDENDQWCYTGGTAGWIQYRFVNPTIVNKVLITNRNYSSNTCAIKNFTVQGSNDGSTWTNLGSFVKTDGALKPEIFSFDNSTAYTHYRIEILDCYGTAMGIGELQFYGTPDYDSRTYIYDHGVEVMETEWVTEGSGVTFEKEVDQLLLTDTSTSYTGLVFTDADISNSKVQRITLGNTITNIDKTHMGVREQKTVLATTTAVYYNTSANAPGNEVLDISSVNSGYPFISAGDRSNTGTLTISEWWLE